MQRLVTVLAITVSCSHDVSEPTQGPTGLSAVVTAPTSVVELGDSLQLSARLVAANGASPAVSATPTWTSSDTGVAVVSASGLLISRRPGNVTATAVLASVSGSIQLTVTNPQPAALEIVAGDAQHARVLQPLGSPLVVRVRDKKGRPISNTAVRWVASDSSGTLLSDTSTTNAAGEAGNEWTLGQKPGQQTAAAVVGALRATIHADADGAPAARTLQVSFDRAIAGIAAAGRLLAGQSTTTLRSDSTAEVLLSGRAPVIVTLVANGGPLLLGVATSSMASLRLDASSTADALLLSCPCLATADNGIAEAELSALHGLNGFKNLVQTISQQRAAHPAAPLDLSDPNLLASVSTLVTSLKSAGVASGLSSLRAAIGATRSNRVLAGAPSTARRAVVANGLAGSATGSANLTYGFHPPTSSIQSLADARVTVIGGSALGTTIEVANTGTALWGVTLERALVVAVAYWKNSSWVVDAGTSGTAEVPKIDLPFAGSTAQVTLSGGAPARVTFYGISSGFTPSTGADAAFVQQAAAETIVRSFGVPILLEILGQEFVPQQSVTARTFLGFLIREFIRNATNTAIANGLTAATLLSDPPASLTKALADDLLEALVTTATDHADVLAAWIAETIGAAAAQQVVADVVGTALPILTRLKLVYDLTKAVDAVAAGIPDNSFFLYCDDCQPAATARGAVQGTVTCDGKAVGGATLSTGDVSVATDPQGRYVLQSVSAGAQSVTLRPSGSWHCGWRSPVGVNVTGNATATIDFVADTIPALSGTSPPSINASPTVQSLRLVGSGFRSGDQVSLTSGIRALTLLPQNTGSTFVDVSAVLDAGTWVAQVRGPHGDASNPLTIKVGPPPLGPATAPTSPSPGSTSSPGPTLSGSTVTLSWNGVSGATYYGLGVRDVSTGVLIVDQNVTGTTYTATLMAGHQYRWNVDACNTVGCSTFTDILYFQTPGGTTAPTAAPTGTNPGSPTGPGPTLSGSTATLSWNSVSGATYYGLGVRDVGTGALVIDQNVTGTTFTATLTAGHQYRWNVDACNTAGCSSFSTILYFQTPSALTTPSVPTNPSPGSTSSPGPTLSGSTVTLSWSASGSATYYGLGVRDVTTGALVVDQNVNATTYTATLTAGHQYRWNVDACNTAGCSAFTEVLYFQTPGGVSAPTTAPTGTSPGSTSSPGPTLPGSTVTLSWNSVSGATYYGLGVRDVNTGALVVDQSVNGTAYTATLTANHQYRWNVDACNTAGCSSFSTIMYFQTPSAVIIPSVPTNPSPGSTSSPGPTLSGSTVTMSWNSVSGATYYGLGVRDVNTGALVVDQNVSGTTYTAALTAGHQYRWNVNACNAAGCSSYTDVLYFQTPGGATAPASAPTGTSPGSTSSPGPTQSGSTVTLSWNSVSGATYYGLGVRDVNTGALVVDQNVTGTTYTATLTAGHQYRWNVDACNTVGCSAFSTILYFQTPSAVTAPVTAPTGTSPGSATSPGPTLSGSTVTLSWNSVTGATYYGLGVRDVNTGALVVDQNVTGTTYTATLTAGHQYRWNVDACNTAGCSNFSTILFFQTPGGVTAPTSAPTGTSPGSPSSPGPTLSGSTVTLSWNSVSGATYYGLGVRDVNTGALVVDQNVTGTTFTATLTAGHQYRWNVDACNTVGCSSFTDVLYFQIPGGATAPASAPTGTTPGSTSSPGPTQSSSTVTVSWNTVSGATYYGLGIRDVGTGVLVVDQNVTGTTYTATLTAGHQYRWNVDACNTAGCSSFSTILYFQTPSAVTTPSVPTNPSPGSTTSPGPTLGSRTVTLSWNASSGATYYGLGVRDIASGALVVDQNVSGTSFSITLTAGRQYRWNVNACNTAGCSAFTTVLYFRTP